MRAAHRLASEGITSFAEPRPGTSVTEAPGLPPPPPGSLDFRSQTSDNMDRWKSTDRKQLRQGESQKREDAGARRRVPCQANQCHLIVQGEAWVGEFAVWQFPVMQASDIQVWEARLLPPHARLVPDNCCICTTRGSGCVALGGGDCDGDLLMFTSNPLLLEFMHCTPNNDIDMPEFITVRQYIEGLINKKDPVPLRSVMHYREHFLKVPTPQVRGVLTAMAERAQQAAFNAEDPVRDGSLMHAFYLAVAAEKAYDAPKKVDAQTVIRLGQELLAKAGLSNTSPRSTIQLHERFRLERSQMEPLEI